jgi:methylthioribose-1-phosphate isomerase
VRGAFGLEWTPVNANAFNPCFDVTPSELVTSYILDTGVYTNQELDAMFSHF